MNIAVITGASSGIGKEFFNQLPKWCEVDEVWLIARRKERLEAMGENSPIKVRAVPMDLSKLEDFVIYSNLLEKVKPTIKLLINCAGIGQFGDALNTPIEQDQKIIDVNCKALLTMTRLSIPYMEKGSKIMEVGSMSSFQPTPYMTTYAATKAFVLSYARAMNAELKPRGIRVMCVTPYYVKTEFFDYAFKTNEGNKVQHFGKLYPSEDIVKTAYRDLYKSKKDYSACGFSSKGQVFLVKLLPHKLVIKIWLKQQSKPKNLDKAMK